MPKYRLIHLDNYAFEPESGFVWRTDLPEGTPQGPSVAHLLRSNLVLFENGLELGPSNSNYTDIMNIGMGCFSHWGQQILFSSSDNTSPRENDRRYCALLTDDLGITKTVASSLSKPRRIVPLCNAAIEFEGGHLWRALLPEGFSQGDSENEPFRSTVVLLEDGCELGAGHSEHSDISSLGLGRYSHWNRQIWFSSSDNTSPLENGRRYELLLNDESHWFSEFASIDDPANLPTLHRFNLARRAYLKVWPDSRLPDIGRMIDSDKEFEVMFDAVCPEANYSYERKYNLDQLFKMVLNIEGDVAECGTYKGASAYFLARHIITSPLSKRLCLFDSFAGLSSPSPQDGTWWAKGDLASSMDDVLATLSSLGDQSFVDLFPGWIPERFSEVASRKFCFVHIDVDLAEPTLDCLNFFYSRMTTGGLILFDDYGHQSCPGVTDAVDEFMKNRDEKIINLASGGAFIQRIGKIK